MVSVIWALIMFSSGLLLYLTTAIMAPTLPSGLQETVARYHSGLSMRAYRQAALVRRKLGTFELYPLSVDDTEKLAKVTLDGSMISDDETLEFGDPDDRIGRLHQKPFAVVYEGVPAAVDASLAELGHWVRRHDDTTGAVDEEHDRVNPYVRVKDGLRVADPADVVSLVGKNIKPQNIKTARLLTKERFSKYGQRVGMAETAGVLMGFAAGAGVYAGLQYVQQQLLDGGEPHQDPCSLCHPDPLAVL